MAIVTEKSYTRITLALDIVRKIPTGPFAGYHELSIVKHRIDLFDTITVEDAGEARVVCADPRVPLDGRNICLRALEAMKKAFGVDNNAVITIEKNIPVMGGLAGGSANAATTIRLLGRLWDLELDDGRMMDIGRTLGMDVPYFFSRPTAFDTEAGGLLEPIATPCRFNFLLVVPDFGVSTKEAYAAIDYSRIGANADSTVAMRKALLAGDTQGVIDRIHNDFELSVFRRYPELGRIKRSLLDAGCAAAWMTGSGSTVVGIADQTTDLEKTGKRLGRNVIAVKSLSSYPGEAMAS
jgi:4-diphosphocytidyl-2-C-methyl-D-erythritol kinase